MHVNYYQSASGWFEAGHIRQRDMIIRFVAWSARFSVGLVGNESKAYGHFEMVQGLRSTISLKGAGAHSLRSVACSA
jgi:hypothetical protein